MTRAFNMFMLTLGGLTAVGGAITAYSPWIALAFFVVAFTLFYFYQARPLMELLAFADNEQYGHDNNCVAKRIGYGDEINAKVLSTNGRPTAVRFHYNGQPARLYAVLKSDLPRPDDADAFMKEVAAEPVVK